MEKISVLKENWLKNEIANLKAEGISKSDIALRLGIKPQYLNNIINGGRGITDAFLDKFVEEFKITHIDLLKTQTTSSPEPVIIYKSDPKDVALIASKDDAIAAREVTISVLQDRIMELKAELSAHSVGLGSAPAVDTPSVGGCQASPK